MHPTPAANLGAASDGGAGTVWPTTSDSPGTPSLTAPGHALGTVRIARRVLRTVVEQAALSVSGVARLGRAPVSRFGPRRLAFGAFGREPLPHHGIALRVVGDEVSVDLFLLASPGAHLVEVGAAVQEAVAGAVEHILGMRVREVNVYVQDVA